MHLANHEDAFLIARILGMQPEEVWPIIQGMKYSYFSELKIAVLNSPPPSKYQRYPQQFTGTEPNQT